MKLPIEEWISNNGLPREAITAFEESVRCYKIGGYRAALLFSYLAWGLTLRMRLLNAKCPSSMPDTQWDAIQAALRNQDKWDACVFDCTQAAAPGKVIFVVSEDIKIQVKYWKDRRNDCAHYKQNEINAYHVETFWAFVRSNIAKFIPNGSLPDILERLKEHFDPSITAPNEDMSPIIALIPHAVPVGDLELFFIELTETIKTTARRSSVWLEHLTSVYEQICNLDIPHVTEHLIGYLGKNRELLTAFLRSYPSRVQLLAGLPKLVRQLWKTELFTNSYPDIGVYASLLRNGIIPALQLDEANSHATEKATDAHFAIEELPWEDLEQGGFIEKLFKYIFSNGHLSEFSWANERASLVALLIEHYEITDDIADILCNVFSAPFNPRELRTTLHALFAKNRAKRKEFKDICKGKGLTPPVCLVGLGTR